MIIFFAPFPDPTKGDGWMARIISVDEIFKDRPRAYVFDRFAYTGKRTEGYEIFHKRHDPLREEYILNFSFNRHIRILTDLVEKSDFVYAHTAHSARFMLSYYQTGKIITDLHGLASLEEEMMGYPERSRFFGALEESMIRGSVTLVTVTKAMEQYYRCQYPKLETSFILNPIRHALPIYDDINLQRPATKKPIVIYAGGGQTWQQPEKMLRIASQLSNVYSFEFYTAHESIFRDIMRKIAISESSFHLKFLPTDQLILEYKRAHFGLILRTDTPVNRVACPTKLMEYMSHGVIPIVELYEIGDFKSFGYHAILLEDFLAGNLPNNDTLNAMRLKNAKICREINATCDAGIEKLRSLSCIPSTLDIKEKAALFFSSMDRMYLSCEVGYISYHFTEEKELRTLALRDIPFAKERMKFPLDGKGSLDNISIYLMEPPFVTTPLNAQIETEEGFLHDIQLNKTYEVDEANNWLFENDGCFYFNFAPPIKAARFIHLSFTLLLTKGETVSFRRVSSINLQTEIPHE
jgi:hypothetical protein